MEIPFTKLHGNGNDFILIDEYEKTVIPDEMKAQFATLYCDRRFGIGADGVLYLSKSGKGNLKMRILQPDGSEAEMCGNGIRCLAKYAFDTGYVKESCIVETVAGEMPVAAGYREDEFFATIAMGTPLFDRRDIPATGEGEYREMIGPHEVYAVNTGVPHAVIFVDELDRFEVAAQSPQIRFHDTFPKGANVNFVQVTGPDAISIRTFERGVEAETLSCGTGATAAAAVAHKLGRVGTTVQVETQGGPLVITLDGVAKMEGPAATVFTGLITF
ncbi:MAG: Diaminopimelate epimerase [Methanoregula sp. PtaU1.Bin051]|nr:MAG: Diaminopimelate epimerase [Methanoregula sp. PtaU1.Bin051]